MIKIGEIVNMYITKSMRGLCNTVGCHAQATQPETKPHLYCLFHWEITEAQEQMKSTLKAIHLEIYNEEMEEILDQLSQSIEQENKQEIAQAKLSVKKLIREIRYLDMFSL